MIEAICIRKIRANNGELTGYALEDQQGQTTTIQHEQLKSAIMNGQIHVLNLQIDSRGRLRDKKTTVPWAYNKLNSPLYKRTHDYQKYRQKKINQEGMAFLEKDQAMRKALGI